MSTQMIDVQQDVRPRKRGKTHETSAFVERAVLAWVVAQGGFSLRLRSGEIVAAKTAIGPPVRIRVQAARTPVRSTVATLLLRRHRDPMLGGYLCAVAVPDTPGARRDRERLLEDQPGLSVTWLFVDRFGRVDVVRPDSTTERPSS